MTCLRVHSCSVAGCPLLSGCHHGTVPLRMTSFQPVWSKDRHKPEHNARPGLGAEVSEPQGPRWRVVSCCPPTSSTQVAGLSAELALKWRCPRSSSWRAVQKGEKQVPLTFQKTMRSSGSPGTCYVNQAGLELAEIY